MMKKYLSLLAVLALLCGSVDLMAGRGGGGKPPKDEEPPPTNEPPVATDDYLYVEFTLGGPNRRGAAYGLNERGEVVGDANVAEGVQHAFVYTDRYSNDGSFQTWDLNGLVSTYIGNDTGWELSLGASINENGWITGDGILNGEDYHAFCFLPPLFDENGSVIVDAELFSLSQQGTQGFAWTVTDDGDALTDTFVGTPGSGRGGVIYKDLTGNNVEESLLGVVGSVPVSAMNNSRYIVGSLGNFNQRTAYIYNGDTHVLTELPLLGPAEGDCIPDSEAYDINNGGVVVGASTTASIAINKKRFQCGPKHAFKWSAADGISDLGTLGGSESTAKSISESGDVVGYSDTAAGELLMFIVPNGSSTMYNVQGAILNLPGELYRLIPRDNNDSGIIVGNGASLDFTNGVIQPPFMLIPISNP